jgi:hypothetical protein
MQRSLKRVQGFLCFSIGLDLDERQGSVSLVSCYWRGLSLDGIRFPFIDESLETTEKSMENEFVLLGMLRDTILSVSGRSV